MTEKLSVQDAMAVMLTHMVGRGGNEKIEDTGLLNKARSVLGGHIDALVAIHTPPKHWATKKAEELLVGVTSPRPHDMDVDAVAKALIEARDSGLEIAYNIAKLFESNGVSGILNEVKSRIEKARREERDAASRL